MDNTDTTPTSPDDPRFYVGRGSETFGPYLREEIEALCQSGTLTDTDFVWDDPSQSWTPMRTFLEAASATVPPDSPAPAAAVSYPCRLHSTCAAAGHCDECGQLFCMSCLRHKAGEFYCPECVSKVKDTDANPFQDRLQKTLGIFYDQPLYATALILVIAVLLMPSPGQVHAGKIEGIPAEEASRKWKQAHRALTVAQTLHEEGQRNRAKPWYDLSITSAQSLVDNPKVSSLIREQAIMFQMRIALDRERYELLNQMLDDLKEKIERTMRHSDLTFFRACNAYLYEKNPKKALDLFRDLLGEESMPGFAAGGMDIDMMIQIHSSPAARVNKEAREQIMAESFTPVEAQYRMAVVYEMDHQEARARTLFYRIYKMPDLSGSDDRWRRLAMKKIEEKNMDVE